MNAAAIFDGLAVVLFLAAGFDIAVSFIMRGQREASTEQER